MWQPIFMTLTAAAFAWQVHGWIAGLAAAIVMYVIIPILTTKLFWSRLENADANMFEVSRKSVRLRWIIWGAMMVLISLSGAELSSV